MDDLISRQMAIDALGEEPEVWSGKDEYEQGLNNQWHYDITALKAVPSAETQRRKGKWIKVGGYSTPGGDPVRKCSECGKGLHVYGIEHNTYDSDISDGQWKACPNCGIEMEEKL